MDIEGSAVLTKQEHLPNYLLLLKDQVYCQIEEIHPEQF